MALKGDRWIADDDITKTCDTVVNRGVMLMYKTTGSGVGVGDSHTTLTCALSPSGLKVAGMLMNDVTNLDETQYVINRFKDITRLNNPCWLATRGWVVTNQVTGSPTMGDTAYVTVSGVLTPTLSTTGGLVATPKAGIFETAKDENGYARVAFSMPVI